MPHASFLKSLTRSTTNEAPRGIYDVDQYHPREFRQTVTEYVHPGILRLNLSRLTRPIRCLAKFISTGSFRGRTRLGSLRIRRHHDNESPVPVVLIDFNLAACIVDASTGSPDKTGTSLFMPIKVLLATEAIFVRHQELHKYEAVFWIIFLELISRSQSDKDYIQRLRVPTLEPDQLANVKIFIILQAM